MKRNVKAWANLLLFLLTLGVNTLGAVGVINGMSQKEVSDAYPTLITPSPSTFSIWGVIYVLLLVSLIYMLVKHQDERVGQLIDTITVPFWVASVSNILWIVTFSYEWLGISTVLIAALVVSLAVLNGRLGTPQRIGEKVNALAFGLYNGWLIIATVVNISAFLVQAKWDGFGLTQDTWAIIILLAALVITTLIQLRLRNAALTLPVAWACFGIWQVHQAGGAFAGQYPGVGTVAIILTVVHVLIAVAVFVLNGLCLLPKDRKGERVAHV